MFFYVSVCQSAARGQLAVQKLPRLCPFSTQRLNVGKVQSLGQQVGSGVMWGRLA